MFRFTFFKISWNRLDVIGNIVTNIDYGNGISLEVIIIN
jgi:hypothetical protein